MPAFHINLIEKVRFNTKILADIKVEKIVLKQKFGITVPEETKETKFIFMENNALERATFLAFNKIRQNPDWLQMELQSILDFNMKNEKLKNKKTTRYS